MKELNAESWYKLKDYQSEVVMSIKRLWSVEEMCELLKYHSQNEHDNFDAFICYTLWYRINLIYDWKLSDKIRKKFTQIEDKHIRTLMHRSFKAAYGSSPTNLLKEYEEEWIIL